MKILLGAINARYIQTNLAIRYIKKYLEKYVPEHTYVLREWHISQRLGDIVREIYVVRPDQLFLSVYIWNVELTLKVIREVKKLLPAVRIVVGGPEVAYREAEIKRLYPEIAEVLIGGEAAVRAYLTDTPITPIVDLDDIPFPYDEADPELLRHHILYYESSRGCPFHCTYCLSSIEHSVQYFSLPRVKKDLDFFLKAGVTLVKFVDRTFNLDPERYLAIWRYIIEHYNNKTTFHFELSADLLTAEALDFLATVPPAAFQFEIGIQSANPKTLAAIKRKTDLEKLRTNVLRIGENIHKHVDLIVGLPEENLEIFGKSFDYALSLRPEMIQLGFLKVLFGTEMAQMAKDGYVFMSTPPYEVLTTPWLSYQDIIQLKDIEQTVDMYYNKGLLHKPFDYFRKLASHLRQTGVLDYPRKPEAYAQALEQYVNAGSEP
jgi:radical SAM superfamily enzyme YgiQ (UPF0313 family)